MNENAPVSPAVVRSGGIVRRMYDWVLSWAEHPQAAWALFLLAVAESSVFPIPPDVLLIALVLGAATRKSATLERRPTLAEALASLFGRDSRPAWVYAGLCSLGSVLGGALGYGIGYFLWWKGTGEFSALAGFFFAYVPGFTEAAFARIQGLYDEWNFVIVFLAGFTPIPYKVITISAGAFNINFVVFLVASTISRAARFYLVAGLVWLFGEWAKEFIDKYFNLLTILFAVLLVGGFLVLKLFFN